MLEKLASLKYHSLAFNMRFFLERKTYSPVRMHLEVRKLHKLILNQVVASYISRHVNLALDIEH